MKIKTSPFWWKWTALFAILTTLLLGILYATIRWLSTLLEHSLVAGITFIILSLLAVISLNCLVVVLAMAIPEVQFKSNEPMSNDTKQAEP